MQYDVKGEGECLEFWWKNLKQQEGLGRRRQKWEDNVKIDITQIVQKDINSQSTEKHKHVPVVVYIYI